MMTDELVTYEVAKLAREKGFPQDECGVNIGYYAWDGLRKTHPLVNSFAWCPCEIWEKLGEDAQDDKICAPKGDKRK